MRAQGLKTEKIIAKDLNMRRVSASGALTLDNDVKNGLFSIECKTTTKQSYSIKLSTLRKLIKQAGARIPVLLIRFLPTDERFVVLSYSDFKDLKFKMEV